MSLYVIVQVLQFMTVEQIAEVIGKLPQLEDCIDTMKEEIAASLYRLYIV